LSQTGKRCGYTIAAAGRDSILRKRDGIPDPVSFSDKTGKLILLQGILTRKPFQTGIGVKKTILRRLHCMILPKNRTLS